MAIQPLQPLPLPPTQSTPEAQWPDMADATVIAEYNLVQQLNDEFIPGLNAAAEQVADDRQAAQQAAASSVEAASVAQGHAGAAASSAQQAQETAQNVGESVETAQAAAAAAQSAAGLPALAGNRRRPLVVADDEQAALFGLLMSLAAFIDLTVTNPAAAGAVALDLSAACTFDFTLSANTTLSLANVPALSGETLSIIVRVRQGATARSLGWWAGITWINSTGAPAAPAANKIAEFVLTYNGSSWIGRRGASN